MFHAVSWAYFVNAALSGMFFHGLQLSTGNMFVPVVAHAAHNAFSLLHCHLKVRFTTTGSVRTRITSRTDFFRGPFALSLQNNGRVTK